MSTLALVQDEQHQRLEVKLRRELGEQILRLLDDSLTEDILLNPDGTLWVKQMGQGIARIGEMPAAQAASALGTIAAWRGTVLNHEHPILETELPIDGSRFEGIVSPVVRRPVFAIRLRPRKIFSLDDYEADGILTDNNDPLNRLRRQDDFLDAVRGLSHADVIRAAVRARKNILVVGSTGMEATSGGVSDQRGSSPASDVASVGSTGPVSPQTLPTARGKSALSRAADQVRGLRRRFASLPADAAPHATPPRIPIDHEE